MEMFAKAAKMGLRFDTAKGKLSVEDLWNLPLASDVGKVNLDAIAIDLYSVIKDGAEVSFVKKETATSKAFDVAKMKFDIVKFIIDYKLAEADKAAQAKATKEKNQRILEYIARKDDEDMAAKSREELLAMLQNDDDSE